MGKPVNGDEEKWVYDKNYGGAFRVNKNVCEFAKSVYEKNKLDLQSEETEDTNQVKVL